MKNYHFLTTFLFVTIFLFPLSCSTQRQLRKSFVGKSSALLTRHFGSPKTVFKNENDEIYIFEIIKKLGSTEISQGKLTLDPIISPRANKTERYYFTVKDSIITHVKFEEEYEQK